MATTSGERKDFLEVRENSASGRRQIKPFLLRTLVDTHAHIYLEEFDSDLEPVLDRARLAGVEAIVMPAIDIPSIHAALELSAHHEGLFVMAAIHPSETRVATDRMFDEVATLCREERIVAVGESGLDYHWDRTFDERQQEFLRRHVHLALDRGLPLVLHNREAGEDIVRILSEEMTNRGRSQMRGVFHCFGGPAELGGRALALGFHLGIGGTLTFRNAGVSNAIADIDLDHIVLETDSPFLAPAPHRGKRNEPAYVALVAERLAQDRGLSVEEVAQRTTRNAMGLFGITVGGD